MRWANSSAFRYALLSLSLCLYISQCRFDLLASWNRSSIDWVELLGTNKNSRTKKKHGTIETRNSCALYLHANVRLLVWPCLYGYSPFARFTFFLFSVRRSSLLFRLCILFLVAGFVPRFNSVRFLIVDDPLSVGLTQFLCPDFWASPPLLLPSFLDVQHAVGVETPPCPLPRGGWDAKERIGQEKKNKKEKGKIRVCIARNQLSSGNCWGVLVPDDRPDSTPPHTHTRAPVLLLKSRSRNKRHTVAAACPWKSLESWLSSSSDVACNNSPVAECHLLAN